MTKQEYELLLSVLRQRLFNLKRDKRFVLAMIADAKQKKNTIRLLEADKELHRIKHSRPEVLKDAARLRRLYYRGLVSLGE